MTKITKEQVLENLEEVKKYIQEAEQKTEEKKKVVIEIKNRFTGEIKFTSEKSTIREACEDNKADLRGADLSGADLSGADLYGADLRGANLSEAKLHNAKFYGKCGMAKINKSQLDDFMKALGVIVDD
jgi:hypothetical protein